MAIDRCEIAAMGQEVQTPAGLFKNWLCIKESSAPASGFDGPFGHLAHRVVTPDGPIYTIPCEPIFNQHPDVVRSALVGLGPAGRQRAAIVVEPHPDRFPSTADARATFTTDLRRLAQCHSLTSSIDTFLFHPSFPVDVRHNAKIFREKLSDWAARQLGLPPAPP